MEEACEVLAPCVSSAMGQGTAAQGEEEEEEKDCPVGGQNILRTWEGKTGNWHHVGPIIGSDQAHLSRHFYILGPDMGLLIAGLDRD